MAVLAIAAAGAGVGAAIGGTFLGTSAAAWGWMAGSMLGSYLLAPDSEGPRLTDNKVSGTEYGQPIPWVAGSPRISGQVVWASEMRETENTESAGKGGGAEVTTYSYSVDLLILLTENEIAGVSRIWKNGELVWNGTTTKDGVWNGLTIYTGTADQLPDPTYEAAVGVGNAPAYRGRGYVVIQGLQLGGSKYIPNLTFEVGTAFSTPNMVFRTMIISAFSKGGSVSADFEQFWKYDPAHTEIDTYEQYFGEYGATEFMVADYGGPLNSTLVDGAYPEYAIDPSAPYYFEAKNNTFTYDECYVKLDFLDASNNRVAVISTPSKADGFSHSIFYGTSSIEFYNERAPWVGVYTQTQGYFKFEEGGLRYTNLLVGSNYNDSFFFACNAKSITKVKVTQLTVRMSYAWPSDGAWVFFRKYGELQEIEGVGAPEQGTEFLRDSIVQMFLRAGYDASEFSSAAIGDTIKPVRAVALSQVASTRSALELLQRAFFLECVASDKIYLRPRSTTSVASISFADLGCSDNAVSDVEPLALKQASDLELPAQLALTYPNMAGDYNTDTQFSDRLLSGQESTSTIQMALGMTPGEAKGVVDALLFDAVAGRVSTTLSLPLKYAYLEPGDVVTVTNFDGRTYRLRVMVRRDLMIRLEFDCVLDDVQALNSAEITDTGYISTADVVQVANTLWDALDMPLLRDADNGPGYYVAVTPAYANATDEWPGAVVARAWNTTDYEQLYSTPDACVMGTCGTTLGSWAGGNVFDEANTLTVTVRGQLASSTRDAMLGDLTINALLVGSEVIRFRLAALVSSNADTGQYTYLLSGLLRGQRGTEWAMAGHVASEACVLLNGKLRHVASQTNQIGMSRNVKAVTAGKLLSSAAPEVFTDTGVALKPFSPANPRALTGTDVVVTWQRRTRLSYRLVGSSPTVPLGEASESYRVRIYDGATLVRTATVSTPTYTYAAADIAVDGFVSSDPISFEICQMSETVGAGYPATVTGTAP